MEGGGGGDGEEKTLRQVATRWKQRSSVGAMQLLPANVALLHLIPSLQITAAKSYSNCWSNAPFFLFNEPANLTVF